MEFKDGVPQRWKTVVAIPMLLGSVADATESVHQLQLHFLSNPDPNLRFALLADYTDASAPHMPEDDERLNTARLAIDALNVRHGTANGEARFFLFIRDRKWSETENRWMGWERKRGKLEEFNRYLLGHHGGNPQQMHPVAGDPAGLREVRFVVTLDADTQLPYGSAIRLIETLAHPLNRPVIDSKSGLVSRGYSIIQPRVDTMLPSAMATRFSRLFTDASGSDPYTHVISDVYQDAFGEGSYHGKGIYDLEAFEKVLGNRFPDATLLSHDLIEGAHVRTGVASDVVLLDKFPPHYAAAAKRDHRWIRGDWQIIDWIGNSVPTRLGRSQNPISLLNRWKIADNLRRSLLAPASVAMLLGGWFLGPTAAIAASTGVA
ncbi:glycosyl transferase, partial [bacterium]